MIEPRIRSEAFLRQDMQAVLQAIVTAHDDLALRLPQPEIGIYRAGFMAAMESIASAFHIELDIPLREAPAGLLQERRPELRIVGAELDLDN